MTMLIDSNVDRLKPDFPRYTDLPFPPYRFLPGRHPHPVASPQGHSYLPPGHREPPVPYFPPDQWRKSDAYLFGCDLYNHGFWWEAHEAWEGLWHVVPNPSPQRRYLQGIIQVSAGHLQTRLAKAAGIKRLRDTSRRHLDLAFGAAGDGSFMGVALGEWIGVVEAYWDLVLASDPPSHRLERFPFLRPMEG